MRTTTDLARPDPRKDLRPESESRARAAARVAELRQHNAGLTDDGTDKFACPAPPDGWSYEWKRRTVVGYEDPSYLNRIAITGWEPVDSSRHPEMMPKGFKGAIERDGMVLCERPAEITEDMRRRDLKIARDQVRTKQAQITSTAGVLSDPDSKVPPVLKQSYSPVDIPD